MAVANLYHVTETLRVLLRDNLARLLGAGESYSVTTQPPETLSGQSFTVNLFLYHVAEDPTYKNQPIPGAGPGGVSRTPMALMLYYIVTAHHEVNEQFVAETEQQLMGAALKTFHDYPIITSETSVVGTPVMPETMAEGGQNWLEVTLRPVTPEEALHFWASEQSQTARLSAYYEVRAVFLTPEEPTAYPGTVLSVGSYVTLMNAPALRRSVSTVRFTPPASTGLGAQSRTASPARPFLLRSNQHETNPAARFTLEGSSLQAGSDPVLVLRHPDFKQLQPPRRDIPVEVGQNAVHGWAVQFASERVEVQLGSALSFTDELGQTQTIPLNPGDYMVAVECQVGQYQAGASARPMVERSNFLPLMVGAFIESSNQPHAASADLAERRRFALALSPAFDIARNNADPVERLDVRLTVDGIAYERVEAPAGLTSVAQFCVTSTPSGVAGPGGVTLYDAVGIVLSSHFDPDSAGEHSVRLIIEGVDSNPFWLEVT